MVRQPVRWPDVQIGRLTTRVRRGYPLVQLMNAGRHESGAWRRVAALLLPILGGCGSPGEVARSDVTPPPGPVRITALGRLEPRDGIRRVAGPSRPAAVIAKMLVEEGDQVRAGQPLAILDTQAEDAARVARATAELANAARDLARLEPLVRDGMVSVAARDEKQLRVDIARADLLVAQAAVDKDTVHAPVAGQIIALHARAGERVGQDGIAEIGQTDAMFAVAEVYETDVARVRVGHRATMRSPALDGALTGKVDRIGLKVGKLDVQDVDPVARTDARVVAVRIKLDDSARAARLSNLQVDVTIEP